MKPIRCICTGFAELESSLQVTGLGGLQELPEEDQDEGELPSLPPGKDPAAPRLTSPLHNKGPAANKQMVGLTPSTIHILQYN